MLYYLRQLVFVPLHITVIILWYQVIPKTGNIEGRRILGPIKKEDGGLYMCTAQNQFGQKTEQMTQVEVLCKYTIE